MDVDARQITTALRHSREQLKGTAETQGTCSKLRTLDGVPIAPNNVNTVTEALDRSSAQFNAFQTVKDCLQKYLESAATLPVSSGALCLEEANIFTTNAADQALQSLPHSLSNLIATSILTLVEERRIEAFHVLTGAQLQLLVVHVKQARRKQQESTHKRSDGHVKSKEESMIPQGRSSGRMGPPAERSGFLGARQDRKVDIQEEELDAMLARKSYMGKADAEADQLRMQPSAVQWTQRPRQGHGARSWQQYQQPGGGGFLNKR